MKDIIDIIVQNGIGVGSFIALLLYIFNDKKESNTIMTKVSDTLIGINISLATLTDRVDKIEEKIKD